MILIFNNTYMKKIYYITSDCDWYVFEVETDDKEETIISINQLGYYSEGWDDYDKESFPDFDVVAADETSPDLTEKEQKVISYLIQNY